MERPKQSKLTRDQRVAVIVGVVDVAIRAVALVDLARRPAAQVHGPKAAWAACLAIFNGLGAPAAYFLIGRRHPTGAEQSDGIAESG